MSLNSILKPETMREHRATWYVWAGSEKIRYQSTMRGAWGFDVTCSCEWESHTGGATRRSVEDDLFDHRFSAQCEAETAAEMRAAGLDPDNQAQLIAFLKAQQASQS